jgi:non-heme chloroperoxidase
MPYVRLLDGTSLWYEDEGEGPPLVFVPGWTFTTSVWRRQLEALAARHRVISLDLRGMGRSGRPATGHSFSRHAADVAELLELLQVRGATLIGWAMGATVAVHLVAEQRDADVRRLVWVDHSPAFFKTGAWPFALYGELAPAQLDATLDLLVRDRPAATDALLDDIFSSGIDEPDRRQFYAEAMQTPTDLAVRLLAAVAATDLRPYLPALALPCLFVNGERSIVPCAVGDWLAGAVQDGRAETLADAGHAPFWDRPAEFNSLVSDFASA